MSRVNPSALTSIKQAFEAGFKTALRGGRIGQVHYKSQILILAFERGFKKAKEGKQ